MAAMLEVGSGFHPELSGRDNVYLNGAILGMSKSEIDKKFDSIVDFSGVADFIDQPVKNYSSGMYVRLGFSVSIHVEPDILLVDEVLAVGDMAFQEKCTEKFSDLRREGRTVVVVSHAIEQMRTFCDEAAWLHHGQLMGVGVANDIITEYADQAHDVRSHGDGPGQGSEFTADGRHGSGEARIDRVEILDASGQDVEQVRNGDAVRLRLYYTCHELVPTPVFGFAIEHESGFRLSAHNTMDSDVTVPPMEPGSGSIDLVIPSIPMRPGVFRLVAAITGDRAGRVLDYIPRARTFDVIGRPIESGGVTVMHSRFENLVRA
jgi:ABC-2 type transport system ATP-binding protein